MTIQFQTQPFLFNDPPDVAATIVTGDCLSVMQSLPDQCVDLVFADPPYNLQLQQELKRPDGSTVDGVDDAWDQYADYVEYDALISGCLTESQRILKDTGTLWIMGTYHNIYRVGALMQDMGFWLLNSICWIKHNPTPQFRGVRFCNAHEELIWAAKSKKHAKGYTFNYHEMKAANHGKQMRSDWYFPICQGKERLRDENGQKLHSTQKPLPLLERIVLATSRPGDLILDPFAGTGTTGIAALTHGRRCLLIEKDLGTVETCLKPRFTRFAASK